MSPEEAANEFNGLCRQVLASNMPDDTKFGTVMQIMQSFRDKVGNNDWFTLMAPWIASHLDYRMVIWQGHEFFDSKGRVKLSMKSAGLSNIFRFSRHEDPTYHYQTAWNQIRQVGREFREKTQEQPKIWVDPCNLNIVFSLNHRESRTYPDEGTLIYMNPIHINDVPTDWSLYQGTVVLDFSDPRLSEREWGELFQLTHTFGAHSLVDFVLLGSPFALAQTFRQNSRFFQSNSLDYRFIIPKRWYKEQNAMHEMPYLEEIVKDGLMGNLCIVDDYKCPAPFKEYHRI